SLKSPLYVIPGNHDKREEMRSAFKDTPYMPKEGFIQYAIDDYPVRLIGLDTLVEGEVYGRLCEERVRWLENTLEQSPEKPTLIFMHHPPKKIGSKLFDEMICFCPPAFESLIEKDPVIGIIAGHYHHFCVNSFGKKPCFIAPSVAPVHYFAHPEDRDVTALELEDPAITLHLWEGDTGWVSHVRRIKENYKRLDWQSLKKKENVAPCLL